MEKRITKQLVREAVDDAYKRFKDDKGGRNADYIPYLANVPSGLFGISLCFPDGDTIQIGDYDYVFGIESISKVPTAALVLKEYGAETIMEMIGADATGMPFNSIIAILLENEHPSTPLVNAGAISAVSMVQPVGNSEHKWHRILQNIEDMCGSKLKVIDELYKSESVSNYNNRAIAWLLKNYNRIYDEPELALDLYTRQCSLGITCTQLAVCAATIANNGHNPVTGKQVFPEALTPKLVSMIASVGFYERTGDWMFSSGIPAKTGVGGGIMGVMPGVFGIAAFAPPIDMAGNSVKAQRAIRHVMYRLGLNIYNGDKVIVTEHEKVYSV